MTYSAEAVERAMTIHQALLHALHGRQTWLQVADVIGLSPRTVRRWRVRLEPLGCPACSIAATGRRRPGACPWSSCNGFCGSIASGTRASTCDTSINWPAETTA